jgi:hypothetical protein
LNEHLQLSAVNILSPVGVSSSTTPLSSPLGTSCFQELTFSEGFSLYQKLANCGTTSVLLYNIAKNETIELKTYCDNRSCLNPECQKHRLYQYMRKHKTQISELNADMRNPKAWVFTSPRMPYPIDKEYLKTRTKQLRDLLDISKHKKYGSVSHYSYHLEIKIERSIEYPDTYYAHYHVVSAFIKGLQIVRHLWNAQIKYEKAIRSIDLAFYVSKYASKVPTADTLDHYLQYAHAVYKLKMHGFSTKGDLPSASDWTLVLTTRPSNTTMTFGEIKKFFSEYANQYGFGG